MDPQDATVHALSICHLARLCRALAIMERKPQIEALLLKPLRLMTSLQVKLPEPRPVTHLWLYKAIGVTGLS